MVFVTAKLNDEFSIGLFIAAQDLTSTVTFGWHWQCCRPVTAYPAWPNFMLYYFYFADGTLWQFCICKLSATRPSL